MPPYPFTLNGYFHHSGDDFPYYGFPKPRFLETHRILFPGFEIFNDSQSLEDEGEINPKTQSTPDWVENDNQVLGLLFGQKHTPMGQEDAYQILRDSGFDPTCLIRSPDRKEKGPLEVH